MSEEIRPALTWTDARPTAPGYYWYRGTPACPPDLRGGEQVVEVWRGALFLHVNVAGSDVFYDLPDLFGAWYGPLPVPPSPSPPPLPPQDPADAADRLGRRMGV